MASNNYKLEIDRLQQVIKIQDISIETIENDPNKLHSVNARAFVPKKYFKKVNQKINLTSGCIMFISAWPEQNCKSYSKSSKENSRNCQKSADSCQNELH